MGVFTYEEEHTSPVPPARLFPTLVKHSDALLPKLVPSVKSVEVLEGTGGPGTVKKITSVDEGGNTRSALQKLDVVDEANHVFHYSFVGGDVLPDTVEKVSHETKVLKGSSGGSFLKVVVKFHMKGDAPPPEELVKYKKEREGLLFKALEDYLVANPDFN